MHAAVPRQPRKDPKVSPKVLKDPKDRPDGSPWLNIHFPTGMKTKTAHQLP